jgi:hypothetical protein
MENIISMQVYHRKCYIIGLVKILIIAVVR